MYDNIGGKIKGLAAAVFAIELIASIIVSIGLIAGGDMAPVGLLLLILGPILSWVSSWLLYGFGELIDKTSEIARNTYTGDRKSEIQARADFERISKIEKLRSQGLISEEEYQRAISKED